MFGIGADDDPLQIGGRLSLRLPLGVGRGSR
jgi:hypothetical protein